MPFIAFEGIDGSGKSTLIEGLAAELKKLQIEFDVTREPGGTPLAEEIRQLIIKTDGEAPCSKTELLLYQAGRAQHVEARVKPTLAKGGWVLCDRFTASSLAFQCGGRQLPEPEVRWLNDFATGPVVPDLWILVDVSVDVSISRTKGRSASTGQQLDRIELEKREFHERVASYYRKLAKAEKNWLVLDGTEAPNILLNKTLEHCRGLEWIS